MMKICSHGRCWYREPLVVMAAVGLMGLLMKTAHLRADEGKEARQALVKAVQGGNNDEVHKALRVLVKGGGKENIGVVLKILPQVPASEDAIYWTLIEGACSFTDAEALGEMGETIVKNARNALSRDLLYGLTENRSKGLMVVLGPVIQKGPDDLKLFAVQKLGEVPAPEAVDLLIELLKKEEPRIRKGEDSEFLWAVVDSLENLTGEKFGPGWINWEGWWKQNRATARLGAGRKGDEDGKTTGTVVDSLDRRRKKEFFGLENAPPRGVVVLSAQYEQPRRLNLDNDSIQNVLTRMGIPHEVVVRPDFEKYDLGKAGALIINCAQFHEFCVCPTCVPGGGVNNRLYRCTNCNKHDIFTSKLNDAAIKKIQAFVRGGGYLFLEDWGVKEVLEPGFPKLVAAGTVLRRNDVPDVDVVPARGRSTHPYLKGIFTPVKKPGSAGDDEEGGTTVVVDPRKGDDELVKIKHRWAIDDESWALDLLDPSRVTVLMTSGELQKKASGQGAVALVFRLGSTGEDIGRTTVVDRRARGRPGVVMQVLSHFGRQGSTRDEFLLQNLLLNFLIDANVEREKRAGPAVRRGEK